MICSKTRITRSEGNEKSTSMRGNQHQDHGMLQPTSDGKAVWRATVTSTTGWSHSFTLLRLAPALIWESGERPAPFAGTVEIDATPAENDVSMSAPAPSVSVNLTCPLLPCHS